MIPFSIKTLNKILSYQNSNTLVKFVMFYPQSGKVQTQLEADKAVRDSKKKRLITSASQHTVFTSIK